MIPKFAKSLWMRLFLGYLGPLLIFLAAAAVAYFTMQRLVGALDRQQAAYKTLSELYDMKESMEAMAAAKRGHHLTGDDKFQQAFNANRKNFLEDLRSLQNKVGDHQEQQERIKTIGELAQKWLDNAEPSFNLWKTRGKSPQVNPFDWLRQIEEQLNLNKGIELIKRIQAQFDALDETMRTNAYARHTEVASRARESIWAIVAAVLISMVFSIFVAQLLSRSIIRPIEQLKKSVTEMRAGKFEAITPYGPSQIAELIRGFNLMGIALAERTMVLEASELRYRTVVGTTSQVVWTTDSDGTNTDMTDWRNFTGLDEDDLIGDGWLEAVHPEDRKRFVEDWRKALECKCFSESEFRVRRADAEYRDFTCRSIPIFDSNEEITEWVRVCIDITDRKREQEMRRQRDAANAASHAKSEFLAKMSHELRTPLNAIIGMSKMLNTQRFGKLNDKQLDYLSDISQAGEHLLELINDILDLSKVEAGRIELKPVHIPVGNKVDQVVSTVRTLARNKKLKLTIQLPQPDGMLTADVGRFKQILFNLISNAVKFTPEGGKVSIRCHWVQEVRREAPVAPLNEAKALRIDVEDTGVGISPEDQERLGTEFFQAESNPTKSQDGTGLGLVLTRRLVDAMGGSLWFTSELDRGSTFSFALPLRPQQKRASVSILNDEQPDDEIVAPEDGTGRPLALIIDDHVPTNKLLADWLDEAGLDSASAFDGESGLEAVQRLNPQLILLDIRLPGMSGLEALNHLKSDSATAGIPVFVVSVLEGENHIKELDVVEWFVKPLDKEQVIQRLKTKMPSLFSANKKALIVDDDEKDRKWVRDLLEAEGLAIREAADGQQALEQMQEETPGLVLIDVHIPEIDGFQLVEKIRSRPEWQNLPIIIVTDKTLTDEDRQRLEGNIQAILRKDALTQEQLVSLLPRLL